MADRSAAPAQDASAQDDCTACGPTPAVATLEVLLTLRPHDVGLLLLVGTLRLGRDADAAAELFRRCLALEPGNSYALHFMAKVAERNGDTAAAIAFFRAAIAANPRFAPSHNDLGAALHRAGEREQALVAFDRSIAINPGYATAHHNRGMLLVDMRRPSEAREAFRRVLDARQVTADDWQSVGAAHYSLDEYEQSVDACGRALALDPAHLGAYSVLAQALRRLHRGDEVVEVQTEWARRQGIVVTRCNGGPPEARILLVGAAEFCNVPTEMLFDRSRFETISLNLLPGSAAADAVPTVGDLPPHDIVFNAIGDADRGRPFFAHATQFCRALGRPILNPPEQVVRTRRDLLPELLGNIAGLVVPRVRRLARDEMAAMAAAFGGPQPPMLVRAAGSHGGDDLQRIEAFGEISAYAQGVPADDYYLSDFWDYRSPDGYFRKYRLIFVDRKVFAYHLAISRDWLVHYWRADMADWMRREEEVFLTDYRNVFRGAAADAVAEVARRVDLDYAGMDCTLLADGRVLVFEANPAMLVHLRESRRDFAYKHTHVPRIIAAIGDMVVRRVGERGLARSA